MTCVLFTIKYLTVLTKAMLEALAQPHYVGISGTRKNAYNVMGLCAQLSCIRDHVCKSQEQLVFTFDFLKLQLRTSDYIRSAIYEANRGTLRVHNIP